MTESGLPTSLSRSRLSNPKRTKATLEGASPIAADGGFGPMDDEESEDDSEESTSNEIEENAHLEPDENVGEDFDDFEAGAEDADFGDFDEGFQGPSVPEDDPVEKQSSTSAIQSLPPSTSPYVSHNIAMIKRCGHWYWIAMPEAHRKLTSTCFKAAP